MGGGGRGRGRGRITVVSILAARLGADPIKDSSVDFHSMREY